MLFFKKDHDQLISISAFTFVLEILVLFLILAYDSSSNYHARSISELLFEILGYLIKHGEVISIMATTRLLLSLALVFLVLILRQKWSSSISYQHINSQGVKKFRFCSPVDPKATVVLGSETLHRNITLANKQNRLQLRSSASFLTHILRLLGGDIELNPGDEVNYPCGICYETVKADQEGIQCNQCYWWFHKNTGCCEILPEMYNILSTSPCVWLCPHCNEPNQSNSFLHDSLDSLHSENFFDPILASECLNLPGNLNQDRHGRPTRSKQRQPKRNNVKCLSINCRSVMNKVADIAAVIHEHKPDII